MYLRYRATYLSSVTILPQIKHYYTWYIRRKEPHSSPVIPQTLLYFVCISDIQNHLPLQCSSSTSNTTVLSDGTEGGNPFLPNAWFDLQVSLQISPDVIVDTPISSPLTTSPT